jgi:hypothetical protein
MTAIHATALVRDVLSVSEQIIPILQYGFKN